MGVGGGDWKTEGLEKRISAIKSGEEKWREKRSARVGGEEERSGLD